MKKQFYFVLFILALFSFNANAQAKTHEIGIRSRNFKDFSFMYSRGSENKFTRYRAGTAAFSHLKTNESNTTNAQLNLAVGFVKRVEINEELSFIHGLEPSLGIMYLKNKNSDSMSFLTPGLGYILGVRYDISDSFIFSAETIPQVGAIISTSEASSTAINSNFSMNSVTFCISYRFLK